VEPNSPAYFAGLRPFSDYIIGADSLLSEVRHPCSFVMDQTVLVHDNHKNTVGAAMTVILCTTKMV